MKKMWLMVTILLLSACGGGSDGNVTGGVTEVQSGSAKGSVIVNIGSSVAKTVALAPSAIKCRLVITNSSIRVGGVPFKAIVDGNIPAGNQITGLVFPVAKGYVFELVTYFPDTVKPENTVAVNRLLQYAKNTDIEILASGNVTVNLNLQNIQTTISLPSTVYSGSTLGVTTSFTPQPTPLHPSWYLVQSTYSTAVKHAVHTSTAYSQTHTSDRAIISLSPGTLYVQGEFHINTSMLDLTGTGEILDTTNTANRITHLPESVEKWTFNYPNPDFGDNISLASAVLALVGVGVDFTIQ